MRKFLTVICLFAAIVAMAGNITKDEALKKAQAFMQSRTNTQYKMRLAAKSTQLHRSAAQNSQENYYVFNVGENDGFVLVSGDDRTPAILGYADEGAFDANSIPANMKAWLQSYEDQLEVLAKSGNGVVAAANEHQTIRPLITLTWDQGEPYNNMCPMDGEERSLTGCVATAMAQILNYHKYPVKTTKTIPSYITTTKHILVDSVKPTAIDWENMLDNYTGNETEAQKKAVANLMYLCGTASKMDYAKEWSGAMTDNATKALKEYFDFDDATLFIQRTDYRAAEWDAIIYNELASKRPVAYSGQSTGGGHTFIVDGYDKDGLYHVNWGWGGSSNGYYLLSILDPHNNSGYGASSSTDGYSYDQLAIIGIQPNTGQPYKPEVKMTTDDISSSLTTVKKSSGKFHVTYVSSFYNYTGSRNNFDIGTGVYNTDNELVYSTKHLEMQFDNTWGYTSIELQCDVPTLPDGTYFITNISREAGATTWHKNANYDKYFLTATISGDTLMLQNPTEDLNGSISIAGNMEVNSRHTATVTLKNNGTFVNTTLFLLVNGEIKGGRHFEAETGETKTLEMTFYPEGKGKNTISIAQRHWEYREDTNEWLEIYTDVAASSVTINEAGSYSLQFSSGKVTNATNKTINDKVALLSFNIKNIGTKTYNEDIRVYSLVKQANDDLYDLETIINVPVSLTALQSKQIQVEMPLKRDGTYWFSIVYKSNGQFYGVSDKKCLSLSPYQVVVPEEPDPVELGVGTLETDRLSQDIYNLNGQRVYNIGKGLYIINGKKVIK